MNCIYHRCFTNNVDGTNKVILAGERCFRQTANSFWKFPENIENGVKTRSQAKKEHQLVTKKAYDEYFENSVFIDG